MATVFLFGFGHPESARLAEEMVKRAPHHDFKTMPEEISQDLAPDGSVAVIWCPHMANDSATLISDSVGKGLPTVALIQDSPPMSIDFSSGHIEMSFAPFECTEALWRIELVLARARGPVDRNLIAHGDIVIDQDRYEVRLSGRKIDLTYKEYELLKYIAARPGRVFSREALLRAVWDYDYFGGTRTVDVHVRRLRSKINDVRYQFIETVWNVGYRFRSSGDQSAEQ